MFPILMQLFQRFTTDSETYRQQGLQQLQRENIAAALAHFAAGHRADPQHPALRTLYSQTAYRLYSQALTHLFDQDWQRAVQLLDTLVVQGGDYHDATHLRQFAHEAYTQEQEAWVPLRIQVPVDNQVRKPQVAQLFASLPTEGFTASFEILGVGGKVVFQAVAPRKDLHLVRTPLLTAYPNAALNEGEDAVAEAIARAKGSPLYGTALEAKLTNPFYYPLKLPAAGVDPTPGLINLLAQLPAGLAGVQIIVSPLNRELYRAARAAIWKNMPPRWMFFVVLDWARTQANAVKTKWQHVAPYWQQKEAAPLLTATVKIFAFAPDPLAVESTLQGLDGYFRQFAAEHNELAWVDENRVAEEWLMLVRDRHVTVQPSERAIFNVEEMANLWLLPWGEHRSPLVESTRTRHAPAPESAPQTAGVMLGTNLHKGQARPVLLPDEDRLRHLYVIGATGTGKSTFLLNLIHRDLQAGHGLAVIDPKGDLIDAVLALIPPARRTQVIWIDPADADHSVGLNLLEPVAAEQRSLAADELVSILRKLFPSWGPQLERYLRYAALTLLEVPETTLVELPLLFMSPEFRRWALRSVTDPLVKDFWEFEMTDKAMAGQSATLNALLNRVEPFLSDRRVRHIVGQAESTFAVRQAMDQRQIILADLAKGKIGEHASQLLGATLVSKLQLAAMARASVPPHERTDFYLYVDEFQNFTTAAFSQILAEARAFHLGLTVAHQYMGQLDAEVQKAVLGTVGSLVAFRMGPQDAAVMARQMPPVAPEVFVQLDNYMALARISTGGRTSAPFELQTLAPPVNVEAFPVAEVRQLARTQYTRPRATIEQSIQERRARYRSYFQLPDPGAQTTYDEA